MKWTFALVVLAVIAVVNCQPVELETLETVDVPLHVDGVDQPRLVRQFGFGFPRYGGFGGGYYPGYGGFGGFPRYGGFGGGGASASASASASSSGFNRGFGFGK